MNARPARIACLQESRMVGSRCCSAGVLLPGEYRSSSGSIAGLALTYQSPDLWRHKTAVVKQAMLTMRLSRTTAPTVNVQCGQVDGVRYLLLLGYRASLVTENRRTIERRLIRTLHLGERSILRFRISRLSLARDKERPPPPAAISSCRQCAFRDCQPGLAGATNGRDRKRFETSAYRDAPYLRAWKSC